MSQKRNKLSNAEHPTTIAAIVPVWLQDALAVLLKSDQAVRLVACTTTMQTMLLLSLDRSPDVVVLDVDDRDEQASHQVRQIRAVWPDSGCIALVARGSQQSLVQAAGADEVLLKGSPPKQMLRVIHQLGQKIKDRVAQAKFDENKPDTEAQPDQPEDIGR